MAVVDELLKARERSGSPSARVHAWNYVVGAFDLWLIRARVFYTAAGLIEGALRARLNARMTDHYGSAWPQIEEAVPSPVRPLIEGTGIGERLGAIRRLIDEWDSADAAAAADVARAVQDILAADPHPMEHGELLVGALEFGQLRNFFQAKRLWSKGPKLERLFVEKGDAPPLRGALDTSLAIVQELRNAVAHYLRPITAMSGGATPTTAAQPPVPPQSFTNGLYHLSRLARWMGVDLQHFYESVDTRESTELSLLLEDPSVRSLAEPPVRTCYAPDCKVTNPLTLMLPMAPTAASDINVPGAYACLYHRVERRVLRHRPSSE